MDTNFENTGPLRNRFEIGAMEFGVIDSDKDRIYTGPDFIGSGRPFGLCVDATYYSPAWNTNLRTVNHILPERGLQIYSSQLFEADTLVSVFNGLYVLTHDHEENPETQKRVADFLETERQNGKRPFVLPVKHQGCWRGELEVYDKDQQLLGTNQIKIDYSPITMLRAKVTVEMSGIINRTFSYERSRNANHHQYHGPDVFGNGMAYGRYLWSVQHFYGEPLKIESREVMIDDRYSLCLLWQFYLSHHEQYVVHGTVDWEEGEKLLVAQYID
jgi:hypothetical protein